MKRHSVDIGEASVLRVERGRTSKLVKCAISATQARQDQAECIVKHRATGGSGETFAQQSLAIGITTRTTIDIGKIDVRRNEARVQTNCRLELGFACFHVAKLGEERSEICATVSAIGILALRIDKLG